MILKQLKKELIKNNINQKSCLINPVICPEGALCLKKEEDVWVVTLNERGEYIINERFYNENDACRYFFLKVISDPTYKNDFKPTDLLDFEKKKEELLKKYDYS